MAELIYKTNVRAPGFGLHRNITQKVKRVAVSSAQLLTLHSAPLSVVPAPGSGKALLFQWMSFEYTVGSAEYTGGGGIIPVYHGATGGLDGNGGVVVAALTGASNDVKFVVASANVDITINTGIDIYTSANFAAGNGTAIVKIGYSILTLG